MKLKEKKERKGRVKLKKKKITFDINS